MKELNELVELAKEFDASNTVEAAMAINSQFKAAATRETILAIAEAFRELENGRNDYRNKFLEMEQRAEAAEAKLAEEKARNSKLSSDRAGLARECNAFEAKLAKQRNPDYFLNRIESCDKWGPEVELRIYESQLDASKSRDDHGGGIIELFTRPAPAINLAELVPGEMTPDMMKSVQCNSELGAYAAGNLAGAYDLFDEFWKVARAAMLRNIEGAK